MLGKTYPGQDCSAARALEIVGERWTLLILRDAMFRGYVRYSQFSDGLGIATNVLAKRLETLVAAGLMELRTTGTRTEHAEYHLTRKGLDLKPVIVALTQWGDAWIGPGPVVFQDRDTGKAVGLDFRSPASDVPIDVKAVVAKRRPI
jgi:DNA-binding HxlR family transcriptional regulator